MSTARETSPSLEAVRSTLTLFGECLAEHRLQVLSALQECEAAQAELHTAETRARKTVEDLQARNGFLEQEVHEELKPISGNPAPKFQRTGIFQQTPDFNFALRTKWPIRSVQVDPPYDQKRWKPFPSYHKKTNSCNFVATLKNKRYESAEASVQLFGFRYEIHDEEIAKNKERIASLSQRQAELMKQCAELVAGAQKLNVQRAAFDAKLANVAQDLQSLHRKPPLFDANAQLEQNIYSICQAYGLVATIPHSELPPALQTKWASQQSLQHLNTVHDFQGRASGLLGVLKSHQVALSNMRRDDIGLLGAVGMEMAANMKPSDLAYLQLVVSKGRSAENSIAHQALQSLEDLDAQTAAFASRYETQFKELCDDRRTPLDESQFGDSIDELDEYLAKDADATALTKALIDRPHIGIAAATYLLAKSSAVEGCADLLDDLSRHMDSAPAAAPNTTAEHDQYTQETNDHPPETHTETVEEKLPNATSDTIPGLSQPNHKVAGTVRVTIFKAPWSAPTMNV